MKKYLFALMALCFNSYSAEYLSNHDGDTIKVSDNNSIVTIRLAYIDAPELKQSYGRESKQKLYELCSNADIKYISNGTISYSRVVAEVYCNDVNVNEYLVKNGFAFIDNRYTKNATQYIRYESEAQEKDLGVHAINMHSPKECRKNKNYCE